MSSIVMFIILKKEKATAIKLMLCVEITGRTNKVDRYFVNLKF